MKMFRTIFLMLGLVVLGIGTHLLYAPFLKNPLVPSILADDDEEEEDEEEEEEDDDEEESSSSSNSEITYETIYTKLPDTIVETTKQILVRDSDGDGMYDDEDPHPAINDFIIVKDSNNNGIDDLYE